MERSATDLVDVLAFVRVVDTGSFARAAERMGLSKPVVSRRVARLEEQLGARLLTRTARGAQPTDAGQLYYARAASILADLDAAREVVADAVTQVAGPIRLTAPFSFGVEHLAPALAAFAQAHPRVELDIHFDDRTVDLVAEGYDVAMRIGRLGDSSLVARRIAAVRKVLVGSSELITRVGHPERPADLGAKPVLHYGTEQWRFRVGGRWEQVRTRPVLRSNNGEMLREAATAGVGFCILPSFIAAPALAAGTLKVLLADHPLEEAALHAVMPPGRAVTARVRALIDYVANKLGD